MLQKKYEVIWQQTALTDFYHLIDYIAEDNPYRAESFSKKFARKYNY